MTIPDWQNELLKNLASTSEKDVNIQRVQVIKNRYIPQKLYRFRAVSDYSLSDLENDTIWMTAPSEYNDPFDSAAAIADSSLIMKSLNSDVDKIINRLLQNEDLNLSETEIRAIRSSSDPFSASARIVLKKVEGFSDNQIDEFLGILVSFSEKQFDEMSTQMTLGNQVGMRVCSFSEDLSSILMWSHYADQHRGFCFEFSMSELKGSSKPRLLMYPVIYSEDLFDFSPYLLAALTTRDINNLSGIVACIYKVKEWQYEREWRLVAPIGPDGTKGFLFQMPKPSCVYIGARTPDSDKQKIMAICQRRDIPIKLMSLSPRKFKMMINDNN